MYTLRELCIIGVLGSLIIALIVSSIGSVVQARKGKLSAQLTWLSTLFALLSVVFVASKGPFSLVFVGTYVHPEVGLWVNRFTVTLLLLICVVGAVIQSFAIRYLQAEQKSSRFFALSNLVLLSMLIVAASITVMVLIAAWIVAGMAFVAIICYRSDLPGTTASARKTLKAFLLGDSALLIAAIIIFERMGNIDLASITSQLSTKISGPLSVIIAILIVTAALTRSAQGFFGRWLPSTISAPTPVSALLHAGVVNGGGILLIRLSALTGNSTFVMAIAFITVLVTASIANAIMAKKADIKGGLVFSTMAQMGFMIAECTVGLYLAAIIHLIGHAMYKATLFFASGSQISASQQKMTSPKSPVYLSIRMAASVVTSLVTVGVIILLGGLLTKQGLPLILFIAITVAVAVWNWWNRYQVGHSLTIVFTLFFVLIGGLYGVVIDGLGRWIAPALPTVGMGMLSPWWLLAFVGVSLAIVVISRIASLRVWILAFLLEAGMSSIGRHDKRVRGKIANADKQTKDVAALISLSSGGRP